MGGLLAFSGRARMSSSGVVFLLVTFSSFRELVFCQLVTLYGVVPFPWRAAGPEVQVYHGVRSRTEGTAGRVPVIEARPSGLQTAVHLLLTMCNLRTLMQLSF